MNVAWILEFVKEAWLIEWRIGTIVIVPHLVSFHVGRTLFAYRWNHWHFQEPRSIDWMLVVVQLELLKLALYNRSIFAGLIILHINPWSCIGWIKFRFGLHVNIHFIPFALVVHVLIVRRCIVMRTNLRVSLPIVGVVYIWSRYAV